MSDELRAATERAMHRELVDLFAVVLGLAVERHGDILRRALGEVFDLGAVEAHERENAARITQQDERLQCVIDSVSAAETRLKKLVKRIEDLEVRETVPF